MDRLELLADQWNKLRAVALGRGVTPRVSARLADAVGLRFESFRSWYGDLGATGAALAALPGFGVDLARQERDYNATRDRVADELGQAEVPDKVEVGNPLVPGSGSGPSPLELVGLGVLGYIGFRVLTRLVK